MLEQIGTMKLVLALLLACAAVANADNILVFGDYSGSRGALTLDLNNLGHTVTEVVGAEVPADISVFDSIWLITAFAAPDAADTARLKAYVENGGGIYLTGERPCCEAVNQWNTAFLDSLLVEANVLQVGGQGDIPGPYTYQAMAHDGITTIPNNLVGQPWPGNAPGGTTGGMTGLNQDDGIHDFIKAAGGVTVGLAFGCDDFKAGNGRAVIAMDVNFHTSHDQTAVEQFVENVQHFLTLETCVSSGSSGPSGSSDCDCTVTRTLVAGQSTYSASTQNDPLPSCCSKKVLCLKIQ